MTFKEGDSFAEKFVITQEIYDNFIAAFKDKNPLHTNSDFAVNKGFQSKVMHGNILNGFLSYFIGECLPTKDVIIHAQEIQFKNPVYLNEELQFTAQVNGVFESVKAIEFKFQFKNLAGKIAAKGNIQIGILE